MARVCRTKQGYGIDYRFPAAREGKRIREFIGPDRVQAYGNHRDPCAI